MEKKKKKWSKPKLVLIVKGRQDEVAVLTACKCGGISGDPGSMYEVCVSAPWTECNHPCNALSSS